MRQKLEREALQREESLPYVLRNREGNCPAVEGCGCWPNWIQTEYVSGITAILILGYTPPYTPVPQ